MWHKTDDGGAIWGKQDSFYKVTLTPQEVAREELRTRQSKVRTDILKATDVAGVTLRVRRELRHLPNLLNPDEEVLAVAVGRLNEDRGLLVATNERFIFCFYGWIEQSVRSVNYMNIIGCRLSSHGLMRTLHLEVPLDTISIRFVWHYAAQKMQNVITAHTANIPEDRRRRFEVEHLIETDSKRRSLGRNDIIAEQILDLDEQYKLGNIEEGYYKERKIDLLGKMT